MNTPQQWIQRSTRSEMRSGEKLDRNGGLATYGQTIDMTALGPRTGEAESKPRANAKYGSRPRYRLSPSTAMGYIADVSN